MIDFKVERAHHSSELSTELCSEDVVGPVDHDEFHLNSGGHWPINIQNTLKYAHKFSAFSMCKYSDYTLRFFISNELSFIKKLLLNKQFISSFSIDNQSG